MPQPSGALPALIQPVGDILVFAPTAELPVPAMPGLANPAPVEHTPGEDAQASGLPSFSWDLADYPTETGVRAAGAFATADSGLPVSMQPPPLAHVAARGDPGALLAAWSENAARLTAGERENDAAFFQRPPVSQPLGNVYPGPIVPRSQPLGNVYPGLPEQVSSSLQTGQGSTDPLASADVNTLVRPLPLQASLPALTAGVLLLLALVFLNPDWATGATVSGLVAVIFALLLLIAAGVRVALGLLARTNPRRRSQVISAALLVLCLFFFAGLGLSQQTSLHALQARILENQQSWQAAVSEYQAAGEAAPASDNLARTYVEWGESLSHQQQYADAVNRFATVLSEYTGAADQVNRARSDLVAAYLAWAADDSRHQDYAGAVAHYDALLASGNCDPACQSLAQPKDATTYDHLAEQQLAAQQYGPAVAAFKALTTRFPVSAEAGLVHADYARALWGLGQQQLATACTDTVPTYQQLATQFADTAEGRQAAVALPQPVQVKGRFTRQVPGAPNTPTAFLVQGLVVGIHQYQFPALLRTAPTTHIQADGTFAFPSVPPGIYELVWSSDGALHFYYAFSGNQVLYTAHIGPLCAYDFANVDQAIPSGNG
jgi:tetratricopeptide (TPR) repeat protein